MGKYELAILKTLAYNAVFHYPQKKGELWKNLIWERKQDPQVNSFLNCLNYLVSKRKIARIKNFYFLKKAYPWVRKREQENYKARYKIAIVSRVVNILKVIPFVVFIGLTGKLALGIAKENDDIDLLIITKPGYLWSTRLIVVAMLAFLKVRRTPESKDVKNKICVNMFIDSNHLRLPKSERDLFSAHEIAQLKPLLVKNNSYQEFIRENLWLKNYLPNSIGKPKEFTLNHQRSTNIAEELAKKLQLWYMRKRWSTEVIREGYVRFHPLDARCWILPEYNKIIKKHVTCNM